MLEPVDYMPKSADLYNRLMLCQMRPLIHRIAGLGLRMLRFNTIVTQDIEDNVCGLIL